MCIRDSGIAVEGPGQFRMLGHMGLNKNGALFRVQTTGNKLGIELQGLPAERRRVLPDVYKRQALNRYTF